MTYLGNMSDGLRTNLASSHLVETLVAGLLLLSLCFYGSRYYYKKARVLHCTVVEDWWPLRLSPFVDWKYIQLKLPNILLYSPREWPRSGIQRTFRFSAKHKLWHLAIHFLLKMTLICELKATLIMLSISIFIVKCNQLVSHSLRDISMPKIQFTIELQSS